MVVAVVRAQRDHDPLCRALQSERVVEHFAALLGDEVRRSLSSQLGALVLLLPGRLGKG